MSTIKVDTLQTRSGSTAAVTGAGFVATDQIRGNTAANSVTVVAEGGTNTTNLQQGLAKSWVNWDGTGTVSVRDSFNHSSLTDNTTGDYTITIASAMSNVGYCRSGMAGHAANSQQNLSQCEDTTPATTTVARYIISPANASLEDSPYAGVVLHGDLA